MLSNLPASSLNKGPHVLIAAISGRALAQSARRSGYAPLVADFFGDLDTAEAAEAVVKVEGAFSGGFKREPLIKALTRLAKDRDPIGVVSGAGFERSSDLLNEVAAHWPVLGNEPETIAILKDPIEFSELCTTLVIPHPETRLDPPRSSEWLVKQKGGSGGSHIKVFTFEAGKSIEKRAIQSPLLPSEGWEKVPGRADEGSCDGSAYATGVAPRGEEEPSSGLRPPFPIRLRPCGLRRTGEGESKLYFQRKVSGESISALFLANGRDFQIIGFSRQWTSPTPDEPFRYGGAVQPVTAPTDLLVRDITRMAAAVPLKGLNSADFSVDRDKHWLLEINPRPGATLDIFPGNLFKAHVDACQGKLPGLPFSFDGAHAAAIVYAERDIPSVAAIVWPDWAMDRQAPGTQVAAGMPLCTVRAEATSAGEAMSLLKQREVSIRQGLEGHAA